MNVSVENIPKLWHAGFPLPGSGQFGRWPANELLRLCSLRYASVAYVMIGANAEIGVAVANFFPTIGLSALFGGQAPRVEDIVKSNFSVWSVAGGLSGPIFQGGRLKANYHAQQAFWDQTIAQYKKTILTAFQETSDALVAQQTLTDQHAALQSQINALRESVDLALARYDAGRASYFEVLEAEQLLFPTEDAFAQTERDQLIAVVNLYKALGGGWKLQDAEWIQPPQ